MWLRKNIWPSYLAPQNGPITSVAPQNGSQSPLSPQNGANHVCGSANLQPICKIWPSSTYINLVAKQTNDTCVQYLTVIIYTVKNPRNLWPKLLLNFYINEVLIKCILITNRTALVTLMSGPANCPTQPNKLITIISGEMDRKMGGYACLNSNFATHVRLFPACRKQIV